MRRWQVSAGVLAVLLVAPALRAEEPTAEPTADDTVLRSEEVVVEGEAEEDENLAVYSDTPVQVEVIPRKELERRPGTTASDMLRTLPGIRQQQRVQGEQSAVSVEGMPFEYTRGLVDGQRYAGEIGGVDDFQDLPTSDAESLEVLRGAQALRYGSDATGAVVRIETPDPPRAGWRGWTRAGLGNDHHSYAAGSFGLGNEEVGGWLRVVREKQDGFSEPDDLGEAVLATAGGSQSDLASTDVYGKLRYEPIEGLRLRTRLGWRLDSEEGLAQVANEAGLGSEEGEGTFDEERWLGGQDFLWEAGEATRLEGSLNWYQNGLESEVGRTFELDEQELSGRLALEHLLQTGPIAHNLTFGFDAFAPRLDLREGAPRFEVDVPIEIPEPDRVEEDLALGGVFAIAETELTSWLAFEGGLRVQFHSDYSPEPLPQVAVLLTPWRPDEQRFLRLRASWGRGYRTPSLRDLYQPPVPQLGGVYFLAGNPELDAEHVTSTRLGLELVPIDRLALSVSAFHNDITDHIRSTLAGSVPIGSVVVPPPPLTPELERLCELTGNTLPECNPEPTVVPINSPLFRKANLDSVVTEGIEARVRVRPHRLAEVEVAYTYLDTDVVDSNLDIEALPNEPHHVVDVNTAFEIPRLGTVLVAQARWRGSALTETSGTGLASFTTFSESDPSLVIDVGLRQPLARGFELFADVFNVTDERVVDSYVIRGTSFMVGLTGRFD